MNSFIIDHDTRTVNQTIRVLGKRKDVLACVFYGVYHHDNSYCQIYVRTSMTEDELDHWLWSTKSVGDYMGVCETEDQDCHGTQQMERD